MSSRQSSPTTRRPSQTHSGLPAGPLTTREASANSSICRCASLAASAACAVGGLSPALPSPLCAAAGRDRLMIDAATAAEKLRRKKRDMACRSDGLLLLRDCLVALSVHRMGPFYGLRRPTHESEIAKPANFVQRRT